MMVASKRNIVLVLLYSAILVTAGFVGHLLWQKHHATDRLHDVSFNQFQGPADAEKIIVEFVDYRCSFCRDVHPVMMEVLNRHPDVKIIYRHYPVFQRPSVIEAEVALAAGEHGKFSEAHNYLMERGSEPITDSEIDSLAARLGIDVAQFRHDMKSRRMGLLLLETLDMAEILEIPATPTFFVGDIKYTLENGMPTPETFDELLAEAYGE